MWLAKVDGVGGHKRLDTARMVRGDDAEEGIDHTLDTQDARLETQK